MSDQNIEILKKESLIKIIENSVGSRLFNSLLVKYKDTGKIADVMNDGEYSCAFFVSSILYLFQTIPKTTATVKSLKELIETDSHWGKINTEEKEAGDVVFWEKVKLEDGTESAHVGFALNENEAVSADYKSKMIAKHPIKERAIEAVFRYKWD